MTQPLDPIADMLTTDTWYSITINPDNDHQWLKDKSNRLEHVCTYIQNEHMSKLSGVDYILYPEISSPKASNVRGVTRIHFHGKIKFNCSQGLFSWYMYILNGLKKYCSVEVDTIQDKTVWDLYCTKNKLIMQMLCTIARIPTKLTDIQGRWKRLQKSTKEDHIEVRNLAHQNKVAYALEKSSK